MPILADAHVAELGLVMSLDLDLLGNFADCVDPVALEGAEDGLDAASFCLEAGLQGLDHFSVGGRILEEHVERGRISWSGSGEASLPAPEFHAALVVRVKDPHNAPSPKALDVEPASQPYLIVGWDDKDEACGVKVIYWADDAGWLALVSSLAARDEIE